MPDLLPILEDYRNRSAAAIDSIPLEQVAALIEDLVRVREAGGRVFCIGNGGSQANVQHLVLHLREHGIFAIDLLADNAAVTALANDHDYAWAASDQFLRFGNSTNDMVLAITGKGQSDNVNNLFASAFAGAKRWAIVGFDGGETKKYNVTVHIPVSDYGCFEDASAAVLHMVERGLRSLAR